MRVLRGFLVAGAAVAVGAAMAPGAQAAGLSVTVSGAPTGGSPPPFIIGDSATLTIRVTNTDTVDATDVRANLIPNWDPFEGDPPHLTGSACTDIAPPSLSCAVAGGLAPGASAQIQVGSTLPTLGAVSVDVGANADGGQSAVPGQWATNVEPKADIKLDLSTSSESIANGGQVTVRALISNTTPQATAYGALMKFSIPPEVQVVSRPDGCTGSALSLFCPVGDLAPALTAQRLLVLRSTQQGQFTVLGTTTWARTDPTIIDTQGQVSVTVLPPPDPSDPGTATPTPAPTPVSTKARAASFTTLVSGAPGTGRCMRSRKLSIVLRSIKNVDPVRATIRVTGRKHALVLKGSRAQRPFSLKLPRSGRATVSLTVTLESGRRYTSKRTYRLC
jgi:hypothetical protein